MQQLQVAAVADAVAVVVVAVVARQRLEVAQPVPLAATGGGTHQTYLALRYSHIYSHMESVWKTKCCVSMNEPVFG